MIDFNNAPRQDTVLELIRNDQPKVDPLELLHQKMSEYKLFPDNVVIDGEIHRFDTEKPGDKSGWYVFNQFKGMIFGCFGDWKISDGSIPFSSVNAEKLGPEDYRQFSIQKKKQDNKKLQEKIKRNLIGKKIAQREWSKAITVVGKGHEYLSKKNVNSYYLRKTPDGRLLIPLLDINGEMWNVEQINLNWPPGKQKKVKKGSAVDGMMFTFEGDTSTILLCEGYSTGATLFEATGLTTVCCRNANNMVKVARIIRQKYNFNNFLICADNDEWKPDKGNAGITAGREAAQILNTKYIYPLFQDKSSKPTDFNDLAALEGIEAVKKQLFQSTGKITDELAPLSPDKTQISKFLFREPPPMEYLLNYMGVGLLPKGIVAGLAATGGTGKTMMSIKLAVTLAAGTNFGPLEAVRPIKTLALFLEDPEEEVHRRTWRITKGNLPENLYIASAYGQVGPLMELIDNKPVRGSGYYWLEETIKLHPGIEMLILDPKSRFYGLDENNADHATQWIRTLESLAHKYGICILFCEHTSKENANKMSQHMGRGSSAIIDGCRLAFGLTPFPESEAYDLKIPKNKYVCLDVVKNNYGPKLDSRLVFERKEHGVLEWVKDPAGTKEAKKEKFRDIIEALERNGGTIVGQSNLASEAGLTNKPLKEKLKRLKELGWVIEKQPETGRTMTYILNEEMVKND
jgi:phage/plasmid primase-like uncharacterized protein/biotin operon repressor